MTPRTTGIIFTLLAVTIFSVQDGISKHLGSAYPPVFVAMIRFWAFAAFVVAMAARSHGGIAQAAIAKRPVLQILRGVLLVTQIVVVIISFTTVGLAQSQAILQSTPLLVALLSVPLLGEKVGWRRWLAILIGLVGVLIIINPIGGAFDMGFLLPLCGSLMFATYIITTRLVSRSDSVMTSFFYTGIAGAAAITLIGPFYWTSLTAADWIWMVVLCLTGISGHYFLIRAYDLLDAVAVQPLSYVQLVLVSIIGVTVFGEVLSLNMIAGSIIVVGAGMFTVWREHVVARRKARES